jgi:hypothetical protein
MRSDILRVPILLVALGLTLGAFPPAAGSVSLQGGDLIVVSPDYGHSSECCVWRLDAALTSRTSISCGGLIGYASQVAFAPDGGIVIADAANGLVRVEPATGAQRQLAMPADLNAFSVDGVAFDAGGRMFVSATEGSISSITAGKVLELGASGSLLRVVTRGGSLLEPRGLAFGPQGELYVAEGRVPDRNPYNTGLGYGSIVRVDPASGTQAVLASAGGALFGPTNLALLPSGLLYASNAGNVSGRQGFFSFTHISDGSTSVDPYTVNLLSGGLAASSAGDLYVGLCSTISFTCYTPIVARYPPSAGLGSATGLFGPMVIVPQGVTPTRTSTWGRLKTIYR